MSSLPFVFGAAASSRAFTTYATKGASVTKEEKSFVDWLLGKVAKEDQFYETDPILQKVDEKSGGTTNGKGGTTSGRGGTTSGRGGTTSGRKGTVSIPSKKKNDGNGGFGGLFAKKQ